MKRLLLMLSVLVAIIVGQNVLAADYYVSPSGNDANAGTTWIASKQTIQAGVNTAQAGDAVIVSNGTYVLTNQITIDKGITVRGFNRNPTNVIVNGGYPAVTNRCFSISHADAILDGFTVTNGHANSMWDYLGGGGILNYGTVQNCIIIGNDSYYYTGGGICNYGGTVRNCTISGNTGDNGGGLRNISGLVENCIISRNLAGDAGGVYISNDGTIRNCLIMGNHATNDGGGLYGDSLAQNCTIVGNLADQQGGGVFSAGLGGDLTVQNSIIWLNDASSEDNFTDDVDITYSCTTPLPMGSGNITNNPDFLDAGTGYGTGFLAGDYRLNSDSPCINAGFNQDWMNSSNDLVGNPRIFNSTVDIGAYEYDSKLVGPDIKINNYNAPLLVNQGDPVSVTVQIDPGEQAGTNADWWIAAIVPGGGLYYLDSSNMSMQWLPAQGVASLHPIYQGALFNLASYTVLDAYQWLPVGSYTFYFVIDARDGVLNLDAIMWSDSAELTVQ